jgi:hypothetical protein
VAKQRTDRHDDSSDYADESDEWYRDSSECSIADQSTNQRHSGWLDYDGLAHGRTQLVAHVSASIPACV